MGLNYRIAHNVMTLTKRPMLQNVLLCSSRPLLRPMQNTEHELANNTVAGAQTYLCSLELKSELLKLQIQVSQFHECPHLRHSTLMRIRFG